MVLSVLTIGLGMVLSGLSNTLITAYINSYRGFPGKDDGEHFRKMTRLTELNIRSILVMLPYSLLLSPWLRMLTLSHTFTHVHTVTHA